MKSKKLFVAICNIDDRFIDEDADIFASVKKSKNGGAATSASWLKWVLPIAACLALAVFIVPNLFTVPTQQPVTDANRGEPASGSGQQTELATMTPHWDEMPITQKFSTVIFNGVEYTVSTVLFDQSEAGLGAWEIDQSGSWFGTLEIDPAEITELIGTTGANGYDVYENKEYVINCDIYSLRSISSECAIAVKFEDQEGYYPFKNPYYVPETLGDLIDDLNLRENLVFNQIHYDYFEGDVYVSTVYTLTDYAAIWHLLLADTSAKNEPDVMNDGNIMSISIDVKTIGYRNISLSVDDRGYLQTNILDTGKSFYIGEDNVRAFVDYVLRNGDRTVVNNAVDQPAWDMEQNEDAQPQTIEPVPPDSGIAPDAISPDDPLGYWTLERINNAVGK